VKTLLVEQENELPSTKNLAEFKSETFR